MGLDVLMVGAGEYTTGYVPTKDGAASDKPAGVVAITLFDLRRLGRVDKLVLCDRTSLHFDAIRANFQKKIADVYQDMDISFQSFPKEGESNTAYLDAMKTMKRGDMVTIFTPDNTHFDIAMAAIRCGLHVLIAKPVVKTLRDHLQLIAAAREEGVLVAVEFHKRFDPIYSDARDRLQRMGPISFFSSTMTQPKKQLHTFAGWAGISSDISYYLNSHHIDFHAWTAGEKSRPVKVVGMAARGVARSILRRKLEDSITLMVEWENQEGDGGEEGEAGERSTANALYTASWIAPPSDCHTQQHFHCMTSSGEVRVDQAHRGYSFSSDSSPYAALNPLYMKYTPDASGKFAGQMGYGYRSIAAFVDEASAVNDGRRTLDDISGEGILATIDACLPTTAILEAGRRSLDEGNIPIHILYDTQGRPSGFKH